MKVTITTLVEDSPVDRPELKPEHGLSFYVEAGRERFLFDTGASRRYLQNAKQLGILLKEMRQVVISHGHYDHSGGYNALRKMTGSVGTHLYVKPGFFDEKYGIKNNGPSFLGNAFSKEELEGAGVVIHTIAEQVREIFPGVFSLSGFERKTPFETANPRFTVVRDGAHEVDDFSDEQVLVMKSSDGLVVLLGCGHPGVINILETVKALFDEPIHAVIGGTHLVEADARRMDETTAYLQNEKIPRIMLCHCSGSHDHLAEMRSRLGSAFAPNHTGTTVSFE